AAALPQQVVYTPAVDITPAKLLQNVSFDSVASRVKEESKSTSSTSKRRTSRHRIGMPKRKTVYKTKTTKRKANRKTTKKNAAPKTHVLTVCVSCSHSPCCCGGKTKKKANKPRALSAYNIFVRRFSACHPQLKGPPLMRAAAAAYNKSKGGNTTVTVCVKCNCSPCSCP